MFIWLSNILSTLIKPPSGMLSRKSLDENVLVFPTVCLSARLIRAILCMSHHSILYLRYENSNMSEESCRDSPQVHGHWKDWKLSEAVCYSEELLRGGRSQADMFPEADFRRPEWSANMGMCFYRTDNNFLNNFFCTKGGGQMIQQS